MTLLTAHLWLAAHAEPTATAPTEIEVNVVGPLAELTLTRHFRNDELFPIDTELWFGLPVGGTIDGFVITVGDRVITSQVVPRELASEIYVEAANEGRVASLVEQQELDLAMQRIANVLPGENIDIELHLVAPVARNAGIWELVLPLTIAPRLQTPGLGPSFVSENAPPGRVNLRDQVDAHVHVEAGRSVRFIESTTHGHHTRLQDGDADLWVDGAKADRDLVIRWGTAVPEASFSLIAGDDHGLLLIEPPAPWARIAPQPADIVIVVDSSDTMVGTRWPRVLLAVDSLLSSLREQDTLTLLVFSDTVRGIAVREPATFDALAKASQDLEETPLGGMTNLPLALHFAMSVPSPPDRARTVVLISDGGADPAALDALTPGTTVHTVGIGDTTNRALLGALARKGNGVSVAIGPRDDIDETLKDVRVALRGPVLKDASASVIGIDTPIPIPPTYPDRLVAIPIRGVGCGRSVTVEGLYSGQPFEQHLTAICTEHTRPLRVLWALDRIAMLAGDPAQAAQVAVEYGILTPYTSLVGVDVEVHNVGGLGVGTTVGTVETSETTTGHVVTKEFLQRIPAGRTYQSVVVQSAPGVISTGNENRMVLDGANITDPVTGTFSLNFNFDAIEAIIVRDRFMPEQPGTGPVVDIITTSGTNNLELSADVHHEIGLVDAAPLRSDHLSSSLSGPLLRDKIWAATSYGFADAAMPERHFVSHLGLLKLTAQPNPEHRLTLSGTRSAARVDLDPHADGVMGELTELDSTQGKGQWQWFLAPTLNLDTMGGAQRFAVGSDIRDHVHARGHFSALDADDPLGGTHDIKVGIDAEHNTWAAGGLWAETWLGVPLVTDLQSTRVGWFLQDSYQPISNLTFNVGARTDHTLGDAFVGPRISTVWDPWGNQKTKLAIGIRRAFGHIGLPTALLSPESGLSRLDEGLANLAREIITDLAFGVQATYRKHSNIPTFGGERAERDSWSTELYLDKIEAHRWSFRASWRYTEIIRDSAEMLIDDGNLEAFTHVIDGYGSWTLPTDPWTQSISITGQWNQGPLGTTLSDPLSGALPNLARWSGGLRLSQNIDMRKGYFQLSAEGHYQRIVADPRDLDRWLGDDVPVPVLPDLTGPRLDLSLKYSF